MIKNKKLFLCTFFFGRISGRIVIFNGSNKKKQISGRYVFLNGSNKKEADSGEIHLFQWFKHKRIRFRGDTFFQGFDATGKFNNKDLSQNGDIQQFYYLIGTEVRFW